jgi:hypothetical protein
MVQLIVTAGYQSSILEFSGDYRISGADDGLLRCHPDPTASAVAAALAVVIALMRLSTCGARSARIKGW